MPDLKYRKHGKATCLEKTDEQAVVAVGCHVDCGLLRDCRRVCCSRELSGANRGFSRAIVLDRRYVPDCVAARDLGIMASGRPFKHLVRPSQMGKVKTARGAER